mmetsp:Transcript_135509/g.433463  ORF Transcript_135509/g.433463 Transcript_135509/m.433463 type:complete len:201 (-) Transcript_135509:359-961(-)
MAVALVLLVERLPGLPEGALRTGVDVLQIRRRRILHKSNIPDVLLRHAVGRQCGPPLDLAARRQGVPGLHREVLKRHRMLPHVEGAHRRADLRRRHPNHLHAPSRVPHLLVVVPRQFVGGWRLGILRRGHWVHDQQEGRRGGGGRELEAVRGRVAGAARCREHNVLPRRKIPHRPCTDSMSQLRCCALHRYDFLVLVQVA